MSTHFLTFNQDSSSSARKEVKSSRRVLVVDDQSIIRWLCTEVLCHSGYQVDAAENGADAWDAMRRDSYDLLIIDDGNVPPDRSRIGQEVTRRSDGSASYIDFMVDAV
jgi:CheY-like chemotaxis protein